VTLPHAPLAVTALACAALSAIILVTYLGVRPSLVRATKLWLLVGMGVLPIGVAFAGNVQGFEATKERSFCGGCHVMGLHEADAENPASQSLAARHSRNALFGQESCYTCHADYGMFGTLLTKAGGLRHVWLYATEYRNVPVEEAKRTISLRRPFPNSNCMQCHTTQTELFGRVADHRAALDDVRGGRVSCASAGCHGLAHPFFRPPTPAPPLEEPRAASHGEDR
jgi:nitrate/TMAO reductase-like tetraheme cytochrome c subunit